MASKNEALVVQSKVKNQIKKLKMKCSSDVMSELNKVVQHHLARGAQRAKANGRKTMRATDL